MEQELEVKILDIDLDALRNSLLENGAKLIAHENQENILVQSSKYDLIPKGDYLRIRVVRDLLNGKDYNHFTYKRLMDNTKYRKSQEYTVDFENTDNLKNILSFLSLDDFESTFKERYSYEYKDLRIDFDYWDETSFPFPYVEVEANSYEELKSFLEEYNIPEDKVSTKSIKELKDEFEKRL